MHHQVITAGDRCLKAYKEGLKKWLSGKEHWLFLQTWVPFPGPTWSIMTVCNSRGSDFWPPKAAGTDRHAGKAPLGKKGEGEEEEDSTEKVNCGIVTVGSQLESRKDHN